MIQAKRRVSYAIPPPHDPDSVPRLKLPPNGTPRLGAIGPLLVPLSETGHSHSHSRSHYSPRPRHRLGVASLALDTSTQLVGRSCPEGILYTGGRDGLVISWDLGIPTKRRAQPNDRGSAGKWEVLTGWADDAIDEEAEDEFGIGGDGDVLGDVNYPRRQRSVQKTDEVPYEHQWEMDGTVVKPGFHSHFRQCAEAHSDWVNDIALCNYNQTLVSASSDGTIKAWNPHFTDEPSGFTEPSQIGSHSDYVRCLTSCREQNWVASGSFDRTIKLWDLSISGAKSKNDAIVTLTPPDVAAPKSSVYALACDPYGRTIASGSPERVVRLWDPKSGKRTGKLVGHTDNIRAILISEDAKYLLTGSADASIKLWSLSSQRCLHTFTHHTDSVWSLFSTHPSLEVFYSGDRSGLVCRVDVEGCEDVGDGECILLCQDSESASASSESGTGGDPRGEGNATHGRGRGSATSEGVNKIIVMDDQLLWTASGTSSVRRWRIPPRRSTRVVPTPNISNDADGEKIPFFPDSPTISRRHDRRTPSPPQLQQQYNPQTPSPRASFAPSLAASLTSLSSDADHSNSSPPHHHLPHHLSPHSHSHYPGGFVGLEDGDKLNGIPMDSLIKLVSANDPFLSTSYSYSYPSRARDAEVATLYSAASVMSFPKINVGAYRQAAFGQSSQQQQLQHSNSIPGMNTSRTEDTVSHSHSYTTATHTITSSQSQSHTHPTTTSYHNPNQLHPRTSTSTHFHHPITTAKTSRANYEERDLATDAVPLLSTPDQMIKGDHGLVRSVILNDRIHVLTVDTSGEVKIWDIVRGVCRGRFRREEVYDAGSRGGSVEGKSRTGVVGGGGDGGQGGRGERSPREALEVVRERIEGEAAVQSWCSTDTKAGVLVVHIGERCFEAEVYADEVGFVGDKRLGEETKLNIGKWVLMNLFIGFIREEQRSRKRNSGMSESHVGPGGLLAPSLGRSAPALTTAAPNTSTGFTSVVTRTSTDSMHHSHSHSHSHSGGHHSRRTSASSSSPERTRKSASTPTTTTSPHHHRYSTSQIVVHSNKMIPAVVPDVSSGPTTRTSPFLTPLIPLNTKDGLSVIPQSPVTAVGGGGDMGGGQRKTSVDGNPTVVMTPTAIQAQVDHFTPRIRQVSLQGQSGIEEATTAAAAAANTTVVTPKPESQNSNNSLSASGLMGRLRNLGRSATKRPTSDGSGMLGTSPVLGGTVPASAENSAAAEMANTMLENSKTPIQLLLSGPFSPPTSTDAPIHHMPSNTTVLIAEEGTPSFNVVWRGNVGTTQMDTQILEETMPIWLMDYLLNNKTPANISNASTLPKISFVLMPWNKDPDVEPLPELLNTQQSKLTASRSLRVRKIAVHVHEKLEKMANGSRASSIRSSREGNPSGTHSRNNSGKGSNTNASTITTGNTGGAILHLGKPEEEYEILCNDTLLPLTMTLAAVRQYVWKQGSELVMHYRRKVVQVPVPGNSKSSSFSR